MDVIERTRICQSTLGQTDTKQMDIQGEANTMFAYPNTSFNKLRPRQNGRHFTDDLFKCIFLNENVWIPIEISLKFVPKGPINNIAVLVQIMAKRRPGITKCNINVESSYGLSHIYVVEYTINVMSHKLRFKIRTSVPERLKISQLSNWSQLVSPTLFYLQVNWSVARKRSSDLEAKLQKEKIVPDITEKCVSRWSSAIYSRINYASWIPLIWHLIQMLALFFWSIFKVHAVGMHDEYFIEICNLWISNAQYKGMCLLWSQIEFQCEAVLSQGYPQNIGLSCIQTRQIENYYQRQIGFAGLGIATISFCLWNMYSFTLVYVWSEPCSI